MQHASVYCLVYTEKINMTNLTKAIWLEAAYNAGRCYDMSTDSIRPRADFVSRKQFYSIYHLGFERDDLKALDRDARRWVWRWIDSRHLTMEQVMESVRQEGTR